MRIDCIVGEYDETDVVYIAYYDGNRRLFPCLENHEKTVGYYVIVAEYGDENIVKEYITKTTIKSYLSNTPCQIETTSVIIALSMCLTESP